MSRLKTVAMSALCRITNDAFPHILVTWLKSSCNYCRSLSRFTSASIIVWIFLRFFFRTRACYFVITNAPMHNSQSFWQDPKSINGIYQWSGSDNMTKYDMAVAMATAFGLSHSHIKADSSPSSGAPRPYNSQLATTRLAELGIAAATPFSSGVKECLQPFL